MEIKHKIVDESLVFEDLSIGNLRTGEPISWDELRQLVILATRFATKRPLKDRTLQELTSDLKAFIADKVVREKDGDQELNNLRVQLAACQDYIEKQNIEYNKLRLEYNELSRTVSELQKGA